MHKPLYNYLLILFPFISFLIGNNASTNFYQKIIVIFSALVLITIFYVISLIVKKFFYKQTWIIPFISISIYIAFSYAQWSLDNKLYAALFFTMPLLIAMLILKIEVLEKFFSTFIYTAFIVISFQFIYLQSFQYSPDKYEIGQKQLIEKNQISKTPNIYLVLLDAYARKDALLELGFDNSEFIKFLENKDFFVADNSNANYISTRLSLFTLYMMNYPEPRINLESPELAEVLKGKNTVISNLRSIGYSHIRMGPNQSFPQDCSGLEDLCLYKINEINGTAYGHGNIYLHILSMSPLLKVIKYLGLFPTYTNPDIYDKTTIKNANESLQTRANELKNPLFVEINVWQPHAPYLFQDNCERRQEIIVGFDAWIKSSQEPYLDEIKCANTQLEDFVNHINAVDSEAIVIIMSDHGHSFFFNRDAKVENYSDAAMRARLANLISVKLPQHCSNNLYATITPVNVFPIIFACLTNTQPKLQNDLSYKHQLGNSFSSDDHILVNTSKE